MQYKIHISKLTPYRVKDFVVIKMFIISSPKKKLVQNIARTI